MNNKQNHVQKIHSVRVCNNRQARLISDGLIIEYIVLLEMLMNFFIFIFFSNTETLWFWVPLELSSYCC